MLAIFKKTLTSINGNQNQNRKLNRHGDTYGVGKGIYGELLNYDVTQVTEVRYQVPLSEITESGKLISLP